LAKAVKQKSRKERQDEGEKKKNTKERLEKKKSLWVSN